VETRLSPATAGASHSPLALRPTDAIWAAARRSHDQPHGRGHESQSGGHDERHHGGEQNGFPLVQSDEGEVAPGTVEAAVQKQEDHRHSEPEDPHAWRQEPQNLAVGQADQERGDGRKHQVHRSDGFTTRGPGDGGGKHLEGLCPAHRQNLADPGDRRLPVELIERGPGIVRRRDRPVDEGGVVQVGPVGDQGQGDGAEDDDREGAANRRGVLGPGRQPIRPCSRDAPPADQGPAHGQDQRAGGSRDKDSQSTTAECGGVAQHRPHREDGQKPVGQWRWRRQLLRRRNAVAARRFRPCHRPAG
jgi:hypothetical protein